MLSICFFKQKTAYEMRISDWSSDVCSSDLLKRPTKSSQQSLTSGRSESKIEEGERHVWLGSAGRSGLCRPLQHGPHRAPERGNRSRVCRRNCPQGHRDDAGSHDRSEEHTSELQSLMRISYAVFCLKKKKHTDAYTNIEQHRKQ